jgi:hypothetical protein
MRTTLDIDDDLLAAAKDFAAARKLSIGKVLSDWARRTLLKLDSFEGDDEDDQQAAEVVAGVHLLPRRPGVVTPELVRRLEDQE